MGQSAGRFGDRKIRRSLSVNVSTLPVPTAAGVTASGRIALRKSRDSDSSEDTAVMEVQRSPNGLGMDAGTRINVGSELNSV